MEATGSDIGRLPEELLAQIISSTSPADACRAAAVSRAFLAAADSDAVWSRFLPRDLPQFVDAAERSLVALPSYKARFMRLSDDPALLLGRVTVRTFRFERSSPPQGSNLTKYSCDVCSCSGCGWTNLQAPSATRSPRGR
jgi:hypothetical protein